MPTTDFGCQLRIGRDHDRPQRCGVQPLTDRVVGRRCAGAPRRARTTTDPLSGPDTSTAAREAVDGHHGGGHLVTLQGQAHVRRAVFARSPLRRQRIRGAAACLAASSRNVCGSVALTVIAGFGVGNAMPNTASLPTFSKEKQALLLRCRSCIVCWYTSASDARSRQPRGGHRDAWRSTGRRTFGNCAHRSAAASSPSRSRGQRQHRHHHSGAVVGHHVPAALPAPRSADEAITWVSPSLQPSGSGQHRRVDRPRRRAAPGRR